MSARSRDGGLLFGTALLLTCACAVATGVSNLGAARGWNVSTEALHPVFHGGGVVLILAGLWRRSRRAMWIAGAGIALLALGNFGIPPSAMMGPGPLSYETLQIPLLLAYAAAGALLVIGYHRAYPSRHPGASATAMSGVVVASGCTCCMIMGALSGLTFTLLPSLPWLASRPFYSGLGAFMIALGLARLGGARPLVVALAGQAIAYWAPEFMRASLPRIALWGVDMNFAFRYTVWFIGMSVTLWGFVLAYRSPICDTVEPGLAEPALAAR